MLWVTTNLDCPVEAAGDDPLHVPGAAVQGEAGHGVIVAAQHRGAVARVQLPHTDRLVAASAEICRVEKNITEPREMSG